VDARTCRFLALFSTVAGLASTGSTASSRAQYSTISRSPSTLLPFPPTRSMPPLTCPSNSRRISMPLCACTSREARATDVEEAAAAATRDRGDGPYLEPSGGEFGGDGYLESSGGDCCLATHGPSRSMNSNRSNGARIREHRANRCRKKAIGRPNEKSDVDRLSDLMVASV
jgi:hypothetical protein